MMRLLVLVAAAGCGRIAFDPRLDANRVAGDSLLDDPDLVAYYPLELAGEDLSVNHFDGTCTVPACPVPTVGTTGMAQEFDGISDRFTVPFDNQLNLVSGFTVSIWINPRMPSNFEAAISKPLPAGLGASFEIAILPDGTWFCTTPGPALEDCLKTNGALPIDIWSHVALTWDGATKHTFVDGADRASESAVTTWDVTDLLIGCDSEDATLRSFFPGALDEIRIYRRALSRAEITQLYALDKP